MRSYLRMMLFALGLLAGVQIPGIVDLYYQRLDARLQQASLSLEPFQRTADQHFGGDLDALVAHYGASQDPVFTQDATSLRQLVSQQRHLQQERAFQDKPWYLQVSHLLLQADSQLWQDTLRNYGYAVPLRAGRHLLRGDGGAARVPARGSAAQPAPAALSPAPARPRHALR